MNNLRETACTWLNNVFDSCILFKTQWSNSYMKSIPSFRIRAKKFTLSWECFTTGHWSHAKLCLFASLRTVEETDEASRNCRWARTIFKFFDGVKSFRLKKPWSFSLMQWFLMTLDNNVNILKGMSGYAFKMAICISRRACWKLSLSGHTGWKRLAKATKISSNFKQRSR